MRKYLLDDCPVPHLQNKWEFDQIVDLFARLSPKNVVEIGSFYGATLWSWMQIMWGLAANEKKITSVDLPIGRGDGRYDEMVKSRSLWKEWESETHCKLFDIQGDSHSPEIIKTVKDIYPNNDVDFLFIDGDHSYEGVKADFENYAPLVRPGGIIVFHDVIGLPDVGRFWDELKKSIRFGGWHAYTEVCGPEVHSQQHWGFGIIHKY